MKDDHSSTRACDCRESSPDRPCDAALAAYRRALVEGDLPQDEVPGCLRSLHLVVEDRDSPGFMIPISPETASFAALGPIEEALARQRRNLRSARAALSVFETLYADVHRQEQPALTRLTGHAAISRALDAAVGSCHEELRTAQPGGGRPSHVLGEALPRDLRTLQRGVRQRTIYQHTVRTHPATLSYIEQVVAAGAEIRTLAEVVDRLIICDRDVAFIPFSEEPNTALRVQHPALVRFLVKNFDNAWARSVPVSPDEAPTRSPVITSDLQRTILLAVVNGETDASIARRVGMSRRSVAEHMRRVSAQLGSNSRAQLGYLLATSGLLDP
ncbi:LuxR C-terminal-related transcriptional regulator [Streptomyces sp. AK02-01A]|uniref:LuxR C-terminal-related transcriptional regulator n=1 Tax=Streptomyces sp. AK02-01A TaxID=3028648 RepID=UPI0029C9C1BD|nr:LuxR C-terminal-related transcriptional regulator [Streptomyces sp. AK02-01A]